jgi:hypothetical protein
MVERDGEYSFVYCSALLGNFFSHFYARDYIRTDKYKIIINSIIFRINIWQSILTFVFILKWKYDICLGMLHGHSGVKSIPRSTTLRDSLYVLLTF